MTLQVLLNGIDGVGIRHGYAIDGRSFRFSQEKGAPVGPAKKDLGCGFVVNIGERLLARKSDSTMSKT